MELCELGSLFKVIEKIGYGLTETEVFYVCSNVLESLSILHKNKMIHRGKIDFISFIISPFQKNRHKI